MRMHAFGAHPHRAVPRHAQAIAEANGRRQVIIQDAKGRSEALKLIASAEAETIKIVSEALQSVNCEYATTDYLVASKYLEAFAAMATSAGSRQIYFPFEHDIVGSLRAL